jgi:Fic family protein
MRLPAPPPLLGASAGAEAVAEALDVWTFQREQADFIRSVNAAYHSWDEMRRRPVPGHVTPELAWHAVRMVRESNFRALPMVDRAARPFRYWITDEALRRLLEIEPRSADPVRMLARGEQALPNRHQALRISMMEEAIHSSLIEGAATTRKAARRLLEQGRRPRDKGEQMIVNNFRTIELLDGLATEPLSPAVVCAIHRSMTEGTLDDPHDAGRVQAPGEERVIVSDKEDGVVLHRPPPASELPERLSRLCDFANADEPFVPDVLKAIILHFQLAYDHPFVDGNGRTARALFYWFLLRRGHHLVRYLAISRVILERRKQYARAYLHSEQDSDLTYFLLYHLDVVARALDGLQAFLKKKRSEARDAADALARWPMLNARQRQTIGAFLRDGDALVTPGEHARTHNVTHATAIRDLRALCEAGLVVNRRAGRQNYFGAASALAALVDAGPLAGRQP